MKNPPLLFSVIVPAYNSEKTIGKCLESIFSNDYPKNKYEVVLVDDGSTDETVKIVEEFPCKLIRIEENKGVSNARNAGAKNSKGDFLLFLDSDILLEEGDLKKIEKRFEENPNLDVLCGIYSKKTFSEGYGSIYNALKMHYFMAKGDRDMREISYVGTHYAVFKRDVFFDISGFDERYRFGGEEYDLGYRLNTKNYLILQDRTLNVHHQPSVGLIKRAKKLYKVTQHYAPIFLKKRKFEDAGGTASAQEGISCILCSSSVAFLFISPFISLLLFLTFLTMNANLLSYFKKEKGFIFALSAILFEYIIYLSISAGFILGIIKYIKSRGNYV